MSFTSDEKRFLRMLGLRLREIRESKGWTLEETEDHGGIHWRHLQRLEAGNGMNIITLRRVAKLYKMSLSEMLTDIV